MRPSGSAPASPTTAHSFSPLSSAGVQVEGVTRRFGRVRAIEDVSFNIAAGEVLGLLGPNGAGKTTTMRVITGYLRPSAGRGLVDGVEAVADPGGARLRVGCVPESSTVRGEVTVIG